MPPQAIGFRVAASQKDKETKTCSKMFSSAHVLFYRVFLPATISFSSLIVLLLINVFDTAIFDLKGKTNSNTNGTLLTVSTLFIFFAGNGISMIIGRRRPRLHEPQTVKTSPKSYEMQNLQLIKNWTTQPNVKVIDVVPIIFKDTMWNKYSRESPLHVSILWQVVLTYWNVIFHVVVHLPFRSIWDTGGLTEALIRCPYESFIYPIYHLLSSNNNSNFHNVRKKELIPKVYQMNSTKKNIFSVGYRGIVFNNKCIGYDRQTSIASLNELMSWRKDICYVDVSDVAIKNRTISAKNIKSFGFPVGLNRSGRHPRHQEKKINETIIDNVKIKTKTTVHIKTLVSVLQLHNGYYHWITERLPALCLVLPILQAHPESKLLIDLSFHNASSSSSSMNNPWCFEYLKLLNIPETRIIKYNPTNVYTCNTLYITSPISPYSTHRGFFQLVRHNFLPSIHNFVKEKSNIKSFINSMNNNHKIILLIDRVGSKIRRTNIWNQLRQKLIQKWKEDHNRHYHTWDVHIIALHDLHVKEQMYIFQNSNIIIGVHGAGLSNVLWCNLKKTTKLIEIITINPPQIRHLFWHLSTSLGIRYYPFHIMSSWNDSMMNININHLMNKINILISIDERDETNKER
jgi:hypothetical protein